jgi:hypothetical protein
MTTSTGSVAQHGPGTTPSKQAIVAVALALTLAVTFGAGVSLGRASAPRVERVQPQVETIDLTGADLHGPAAALHRRIYKHFPELAEPAGS